MRIKSRFIVSGTLATFAAAGALTTIASLATNHFLAVEPESGTVATAAKITDSTASGSSAVKFAQATGATGTWPTAWADPVFANVRTYNQNAYGMSGTVNDISIENNNGEPLIGCSNFTVNRFRGRGREGIRICSPGNVTVTDFYMEITGSGDDHADGVQTYGGSGMANVVLRNGNIILRGASNAGIFLADNARCALTLENIRVDAQGAPNGALFFANITNDTGVASLSLSNVLVSPPVRLEGGSSFNITKWENVRYFNGTPVPRPD